MKSFDDRAERSSVRSAVVWLGLLLLTAGVFRYSWFPDHGRLGPWPRRPAGAPSVSVSDAFSAQRAARADAWPSRRYRAGSFGHAQPTLINKPRARTLRDASPEATGLRTRTSRLLYAARKRAAAQLTAFRACRWRGGPAARPLVEGVFQLSGLGTCCSSPSRTTTSRFDAGPLFLVINGACWSRSFHRGTCS